MLRRTEPTPRPGFTLIELLVSVAILAILVALTTAAVVRLQDSGKRVNAVSDINQLDVVLATFKMKHGFYPPSHVVDPTTKQIRLFTIPINAKTPEFALLKRMFPRWSPPLDGSGNITDANYLTNGGAGKALDPNQAMVYFLGGPNGIDGWDTNNPLPASATSTTRLGPYMEFPANRLVAGSNGAMRFVDPWGVPYAYFSGDPNNTYDPRAQFPWTDVTGAPDPNSPYTMTTVSMPAGTFSKDSTDASYVAHPYRGTNGRWMNPGKAQIISAGPDMAFGAGSYATGQPAPNDIRSWAPGTPGTEYISSSGGAPIYGYDDIANFNGGASLGEAGN